MGAGTVDLPPGFTLDQPAGDLPPGFKLDDKSSSPSYLDRMKKIGGAALEGAKYGGPQGAVQHGMVEGMNQANDVIDRSAYGAGADVNDFAAKYLQPEVAAGLGFSTNVGIQAIPTLIGGLGGSALRAPLQGTGKWLMENALRAPYAAQKSGKAGQAAETMLKEGYNPTSGGAEGMWDKVSKLSDEVSSKIKNSTAATTVEEVNKYLSQALRKFEGRPNAAEASELIAKEGERLAAHPMLQKAERYASNEIPIQEAQKLKQGYQASVGEKYGKISEPATEGEKAIASGLRAKIAEMEPSTVAPLKREAGLVNAAKLAERRALMSGKTNPLGLGTGVAAIEGNPAAALGMWANSSDLAKALIARFLYTGAPPMATAAGAGVGALAGPSGRAPNEELAAMLRSN